jgi:cytochrome c-type biogenesis protein CcmH/NrfG
MKFKPIYLYGLIAIIAIAVLIIVSVQENSNPTDVTISNDQTMPDDDVHKQLKNQMSTSPGKENVSEEYRKKMAELKDAVEKDPSDTLAMRNYADFLSASHKMNEAVQYYEKILNINPKRTDIYFSLALIYYNKQDLVMCEEVNNKVLIYDPKNQMALYNLGAIAATQGRTDKAREFWNKVVSINAESETAKLAVESLGKL